MTIQIDQSIRQRIRRKLCVAAFGILAAAMMTPAAAAQDQKNVPAQEHAGHASATSAKLVETVRDATRQYIDVNAARRATYDPMFGCVSGPDHGAMGVHFVNLALVGDGQIDASRPEALIYEPTKDGMRLVGVEYIVDAATWMASHSSPPELEGQAFHLVTSPNQFGLPTFFELHVWAWRDNPQGAFVDWNNHVTCEGQ
jgi:hypothetical protein